MKLSAAAALAACAPAGMQRGNLPADDPPE